MTDEQLLEGTATVLEAVGREIGATQHRRLVRSRENLETIGHVIAPAFTGWRMGRDGHAELRFYLEPWARRGGNELSNRATRVA